jgi:hypothetical protein
VQAHREIDTAFREKMMYKICTGVCMLLLLGIIPATAQKISVDNRVLKIKHIDRDFDIADTSNTIWDLAENVPINRYWSGAVAPEGRRATAKILWSDNAFYVRFEANQTEPLVISDAPDTSKKTIGLWDRDVCEIFIAPDLTKPNKYFEFEIAPTGEWVDLGIEVLPTKRNRDDNYNSDMESVSHIDHGKITMIMRIEWKAFGRSPKAGDRWRGNLFRCVGKDPDRGYLAWQPTLTKEPAFHVPDKFGLFEFTR